MREKHEYHTSDEHEYDSDEVIDMVGSSQTGSGKTLGFILPALVRIFIVWRTGQRVCRERIRARTMYGWLTKAIHRRTGEASAPPLVRRPYCFGSSPYP